MRGRKKGRERWHGRGMKEENERKRKCGRWRGGPKPCVFNDSIKTKIRARILCARVRRESGPESGRFYDLSSRDRRQRSGVVRVGGRCNCQGLNEINRPRYAASFHLSVHSVNDDARLPRIFANRDTRNVPLDVKG